MPLTFNNKPGLVIYLTCGDPDLAATLAMAIAAVDAGADVIELGVPFSDPLADGPVIQRASERAVARGTRLSDVLDVCRQLREARPEAGIILFSYLNPVVQFGQQAARNADSSASLRDDNKGVIRSNGDEKELSGDYDGFATAAKAAGADGVLLTDMIVEEAADYIRTMRAHDLATVFLAAPTSPDARLKAIAEASRGFVYAISRTGITGAQTELAADAAALVGRIKQFTELPVALGFGVSTAEHVAAVNMFADAAVVGSAIVALIEKTPPAEAAKAVGDFVRGLKAIKANADSLRE
jgi:tryptophan synthase alpha chain